MIDKIKKYSTYIIYISFLLLAPIGSLALLLFFLLVLKINSSLYSILSLVLILSIIYYCIYKRDFKKHNGDFFYFANKGIVQFILTILPITLTLLNFGFTLDQRNEEKKQKNEEIIKCIKTNEYKDSFECQINKKNLENELTLLDNLSVYSLLLISSFGVLLVIHNIFKNKYNTIDEKKDLKKYIDKNTKRLIAFDQFKINNPYENEKKYF